MEGALLPFLPFVLPCSETTRSARGIDEEGAVSSDVIAKEYQLHLTPVIAVTAVRVKTTLQTRKF